MSFIAKLKQMIVDNKIPSIFTADELKDKDFSTSDITTISNYDKKNKGSSNKNKKVLISRKIDDTIYYTFDEKLFN